MEWLIYAALGVVALYIIVRLTLRYLFPNDT